MSKERTEWTLKIVVGREKPRERGPEVKGKKRQGIGYKGRSAQQVSRDIQALAEAADVDGAQECLQRLGSERVDCLKRLQGMEDIVTVLEEGSHGLPEADLEALRQQANLLAEKAGREPPYV